VGAEHQDAEAAERYGGVDTTAPIAPLTTLIVSFSRSQRRLRAVAPTRCSPRSPPAFERSLIEFPRAMRYISAPSEGSK
jgi:hypothetical protein